MRSSLIGGLVDKVRYNVNRQQTRVRLFEAGRVFLREPGAPEGALEVAGIRQPVRIAAASYGTADQEQWGLPGRGVDFYDAKGDLESLAAPLRLAFEPAQHPALHPGRAARVLLHDLAIGWVGELHPRWQQKYELPRPLALFEVDAAPLQSVPLPTYHPVPRYPSVVRDLSFLVDEAVPVGTLLDDLTALRAPGVQHLQVFDLYQGDGVQMGKKSLAFRVLLQDTQKTLTDADVDRAVQQLRDHLARRFGAQLRGNEGEST
jgi:phenylalanyl-tRNA synthetase beta chain